MRCFWVLIGHVSSSKSDFLIIYYALAKPLHWVENLGVVGNFESEADGPIRGGTT